MAIINFGELEKPIRAIEDLLSQFNQEETHLILKNLNQRFQKKLQEHQMKENLNNIPLGNLIKRFMKSKDGEELGDQ